MKAREKHGNIYGTLHGGTQASYNVTGDFTRLSFPLTATAGEAAPRYTARHKPYDRIF